MLCTICMRGGSKGVLNKNLREMHGKPLMAYTIEQALKSGLFEHVLVSTDSERISSTAKILGADSWFMRPAHMASDESPKIPVIRHALLEAEKHYSRSFDVVFDLDATAPIRYVDNIAGAYRQFIEDAADILITASPSRKNPYFNMVEKLNGQIRITKGNGKIPVRRQDIPQVFDMKADCIWKRKALLENDTLFTEKTSLYIVPEECSVDIDTALDWEFVEFMIGKQIKIK